MIHHKKYTRTVFRRSIMGAAVVVAMYIAAVTLYFKWTDASVFRTIVIFWGVAFIYPYFRATLYKMDYSLEIGEKTSQHIDRLQGELTPVIGDLKDAVGDVKVIVSDLRENELDKISKVLDELSENGQLKELIEALKQIPERLDDVIKSGKKNMMENI